MGDMLRDGAAWLAAQRAQHIAHSVSYVRGGAAVVVNATVGRSVWEQQTEAGATLRTESRDYLITADQLVLGGAPIMPQAGDRIRETAAGVTYEYEVVAVGGEPPWRYSDPYWTTYRIHTRFVGNV